MRALGPTLRKLSFFGQSPLALEVLVGGGGKNLVLN